MFSFLETLKAWNITTVFTLKRKLVLPYFLQKISHRTDISARIMQKNPTQPFYICGSQSVKSNYLRGTAVYTLHMFPHSYYYIKSKAVPLHAMEALGGRGGIAPTHSRPRH
jgi:hypothetical protein